MTIAVKLDDVIEALDGAMDEAAFYLDKRSGEIVIVTDDDMAAAENEEFRRSSPDWQQASISNAREILDDSKDFLPLPEKFDVNEYGLMEEFCLTQGHQETGKELLGLIKGSGAFRRFKNAIHDMQIEADWYEFKRQALEQIAIEWLEQNDIAYTRNDAIDASGPPA